jgi:hypothetical protein
MNETGQGVPQDPARAAGLYQRACEGGELIGCTNVGLLYVTGVGLAPDTARAAGFFRVACEGGEQLGCGLLRSILEASTPEHVERFDKVGRVGDAETNNPLSDAAVELPELGIRIVTDENGRFALAAIPAGSHVIRVERLGYEELVGTVEIPGNPDFVMLMSAAETTDPFARGQVVGRVLEGPELGLANVEVSVVGQPRASTLSNQAGRFTIRDVNPGLLVVRFARLGYAPRSATVVVQPGRTAEVSATMAVQPIELEPVEVSIRSLDLERVGFYERADGGWGTQIGPGDLERLQPDQLSDALRWRVPGIQITQDFVGNTARVLGRRRVDQGACVLAVFVDGVRMGDPDIDLIAPEAVAAVEIYQGVGTPMQYDQTQCGVVLIWTRQGA